MLAYRHAFHAGNHADVLKHLVLGAALRHMNLKDKGYRVIDTHAGAGGYSLRSEQALKHGEFRDGIGRLWSREDLPAELAEYVALVRRFNDEGRLTYYPGSPALAQAMLRPQDQLRLFELHPADFQTLAKAFHGQPAVEVSPADGFASLKGLLPPPTRRGLVLIDPSYELKVDYARVLAAVREIMERFAEAVTLVWIPQLQLLEAAQLPQRLQAAAAPARKGWLHARLTVRRAGEHGLGLLGSHMFVTNPPHTLAPMLRECLPWLAQALGQDDAAGWELKTSP